MRAACVTYCLYDEDSRAPPNVSNEKKREKDHWGKTVFVLVIGVQNINYSTLGAGYSSPSIEAPVTKDSSRCQLPLVPRLGPRACRENE